MGGRGSAGHSSSIYDELDRLSREDPLGRTGPAAAKAPTTVADAEAQLRAAYDSIVTEAGIRPDAWLRIADVRQRLAQKFPDVSPQLLDQAMKVLGHRPDVDVMPETNQRTLRPVDRKNAVWVGGMDNHLIAFGKHRS